VPSFIVCQTARRHVTVAMNGDGGDELLGGYPRYWLTPLKLLTAHHAPNCISAETLTLLASRLATVTGIPLRIIRKLVTEFCWPELCSVNMYAGFWDDSIRKRLLGNAKDSGLLHRWRTEWLKGSMRHADNPVDRMLWYDNRTYLPGDLLVKMDIASMHCGLETRSPLLDHEVIEYCSALPVAYKVHNRIGKYLLKKLAERYFPPGFVHRRKMGFGIPMADWLRGPLRPMLEETLHSHEAMAPLDMNIISTCLDEFLNYSVDNSFRIWTLFIYGTWRMSDGPGN
jgi:asparagine synthase (glutamine-hydrolysing)